MTDHISFELAKLLKEKNFPQLNQGFYYTKDKNHCLVGWGFNDRTDDSFAQYSAPTIAEVVMWIYEKHGIWIIVETLGDKNDYPKFNYKVISLTDLNSDAKWLLNRFNISYEELIDKSYNNPIEAYEAAIKYCLTKLI